MLDILASGDRLATRRLFPTLQAHSATTLLITRPTNASLTIALRPANCTSDLAEFQLANAYSSSAPTMTRASAASPPVSGTFSLAYGPHTLANIPADVSAKDLLALLQTIPGFGDAQVTRTKDCAGFRWTVKWLTGGQKPALTVSSSSLVGNSASVAASVSQVGGALFKPIQDDMMRTYHAQSAQVEVIVNEIASRCAADQCGFTWSEAATPVVSEVDTGSMAAIVITGTGFSDVLGENQVLIGEVACVVSEASSTRIVCAAGQNPVGTYAFRVNVVGKGWARVDTQTMAVFELTVSSVSPQSGSTGKWLMF